MPQDVTGRPGRALKLKTCGFPNHARDDKSCKKCVPSGFPDKHDSLCSTFTGRTCGFKDSESIKDEGL